MGVLVYAAQIAGALVLRQGGNVDAVQLDAALVGLPGTADGVLHGALSGAVAADDGDEIPVPQRQAQVVQRHALVHGAGEVVDTQRHAVLGNRGTQNGDLCGGVIGRLQRRCGVGYDQVDLLRHEGVDDGGADVLVVGGVLHVNGHVLLAQLVLHRVDEALGSGVQCVVGHQLAHADGILLGAVGIAGVVRLGVVGLAAAGGHAHAHDGGQQGGRQPPCDALFPGVVPPDGYF